METKKHRVGNDIGIGKGYDADADADCSPCYEIKVPSLMGSSSAIDLDKVARLQMEQQRIVTKQVESKRREQERLLREEEVRIEKERKEEERKEVVYCMYL